MTPTIKATANHLPGNGQRDGEWNDLPADIVGNTQSDNEGNGEVNIDEPTHRIFLRAHTQVAEGDVAENCEGQQADQGDVEFNVQEWCLSVTVGISVTLSLVVSNQQINRSR